MKKTLVLALFLAVLATPAYASASIFSDLIGAVRDLQKQVVDLISVKIDLPKAELATTTIDKNWKTFSDPGLGFEVRYPADWSTTTLFRLTAEYKTADALVRSSRADFLSKIVKPSSTALEIVVQDSAVFFRSGEADEQFSNLSLLSGKVSTSTRQVGSSTVLYILHSAKTDPNKFGGGSTEKYVFTKGSASIVAEANYSSEVPGGVVKAVFDKMLTTFKFVDILPLSIGTSTDLTASSTASATSTDATASATSSVNQTAGAGASQ